MSHRLFDVDESFTIRGRGIVLLPGVPKYEPHPRVSPGMFIELHRPDGTVLATTIQSIEWFQTPSQPAAPLLMPPEIGKEDVPVATEVWLVNHPGLETSECYSLPSKMISNREEVRTAIRRINMTLALMVALGAVAIPWAVLGGWPLDGWLARFSTRFPLVVATVALIVSAVVLDRNRPLSEPAWACPDQSTVKYGVGVVVITALAIIGLIALLAVAR